MDVGETPFFIGVDYEKKAVAISIRGTLSMQVMMVTDCYRYYLLLHAGHHDRPAGRVRVAACETARAGVERPQGKAYLI